MAFRFDPRGDLPPPMIQSTYYRRHPLNNGRREDNNRHGATGYLSERFTTTPGISAAMPAGTGTYLRTTNIACHDWIFSSASNAHIAIDRSAFKTYTSFKSYVLTVADGTQVKVCGIGTVELKIRRQPGSKEWHVVTLENVLHVPKWICNIFSDVYFEPIDAFEHTWTEFGVSFLRKEDHKLSYWGFTEGSLGLERLVLAKKLRGRSPMLEDKDREVWCVNLTWPQGQRDKWEAQLAAEEKRRHDREQMKLKREVQSGLTEMSAMAGPTKTTPSVSLDLTREHRTGLADISANIVHRRAPSNRGSSLKAPTSRSRASSFTERFSTIS